MNELNIIDLIKENYLVVIPMLNVLGLAIKHTKRISDKYIPITLVVIGVFTCIGIGGANVDAAIQGILVAGASVLANEIVKQIKK